MSTSLHLFEHVELLYNIFLFLLKQISEQVFFLFPKKYGIVDKDSLLITQDIRLALHSSKMNSYPSELTDFVLKPVKFNYIILLQPLNI